MAIKLFEKYGPDRANAPTTGHPVGSIKNESVPGANDGTPLDQEWGNDYAGFDAALFAEAEITPSGLVDTAINSQRLQALIIAISANGAKIQTVADAKNNNLIKEGSLVILSDRGYGIFKAQSGETPDERRIIQSTVKPTLSFVLQDDPSNTIILRQWGLNGVDDTDILQDALDYANGRPVDVFGASNLNGTITGVTDVKLFNSAGSTITLSNALIFDNTNTNARFENIHFDATNVPNGVTNAWQVEVSGHAEFVHSDCKNAPRTNLSVARVDTVSGWGGDFSDAGRENFVDGGVNIGCGLILFGVKTSGKWYNPIAIDCWQMGVFINGTGTDICKNTVVYNPFVKNAQDNGIRCQPEDAAYLGVQDSGFVNPIVDGSQIDNIRINGTRCFCVGGRSTNSVGWSCKTDGGTDLLMEGIYSRGCQNGIGARVVVDLNGLIVKNCNVDATPVLQPIYVVQIDATKNVHNVSLEGNETQGGTQADLAVILMDKAKGLNISATGNTYKGVSTNNYREVWGTTEYCKSINNKVTKDGGNRSMINLSNCDHFAVMGFNGYDDAATSLWLIEANNGTTNSEVVNSAALNMASGVLVGGTDAAQVTDVGGNFITIG